MAKSFLENFAYFMMKMAKFFIKLAIFCVLIYLVGIRLFDFGHKLFYEKAMSDGEKQEITFEIKKDDNVEIIADNLKNIGLIDDTLVFKFRAKIYKTKFTPNVYNLNTNMTIKNMLDIFDSPTEDYIAVTKETDSVYQLSPEGDDMDETGVTDE